MVKSIEPIPKRMDEKFMSDSGRPRRKRVVLSDEIAGYRIEPSVMGVGYAGPLTFTINLLLYDGGCVSFKIPVSYGWDSFKQLGVIAQGYVDYDIPSGTANAIYRWVHAVHAAYGKGPITTGRANYQGLGNSIDTIPTGLT